MEKKKNGNDEDDGDKTYPDLLSYQAGAMRIEDLIDRTGKVQRECMGEAMEVPRDANNQEWAQRTKLSWSKDSEKLGKEEARHMFRIMKDTKKPSMRGEVGSYTKRGGGEGEALGQRNPPSGRTQCKRKENRPRTQRPKSTGKRSGQYNLNEGMKKTRGED